MQQKQKSILFADDQEDYRASLVRSLLRDYEVKEVSSGRELGQEARQREYDLIITDCDMEIREAGLFAIKKIRQYNQETPIIFLSARAKDLEERAKLAGANEVLTKPLDFKEFKRVLEKYLS